MSAAKKTKVVDGYATLRAAVRAGGKKSIKKEVAASPAKKAAPSGKSIATPGAKRISRTVLPSKIEITCYECGFEFNLTGRSSNTYCPKCRVMIDLVEHTIDGPWTGSLKTAGTIVINETGVLEFGKLIGGDIILKGAIKSGAIKATRTLEIGSEADFKEDQIEGRDLRVSAGSKVWLKRKVHFRNVDIHGELRARIESSGTVTIHPGALLKGDLRGQGLVVDEGGGLQAKLKIEPVDEPEEEDLPLQKTA